MRLDYVPDPPTGLSPDDEAVVQRVRARRGEKGLIPLDLTLLHAPKVTDGWNAHLGAIRTKTSLPAEIREIAILRPALINGAWFEWNSHLPIYQASASYTDAKLVIVKSFHPQEQGALSDVEWLVLRYADAMTRSVQVPQELFDELRSSGGFSKQEIVEITATVATYNMVSRFLVAMDVGEANDKVPEGIERPE